MARKKKHLNSGPQEEVVDDATLSAYSVLQMRNIGVEHFDAGVMVFTRTDHTGATRLVHTKWGNEFAVLGMMETFMDEHISPNLSQADQDEDEDEDEDNEAWKQSS